MWTTLVFGVVLYKRYNKTKSLNLAIANMTIAGPKKIKRIKHIKVRIIFL